MQIKHIQSLSNGEGFGAITIVAKVNGRWKRNADPAPKPKEVSIIIINMNIGTHFHEHRHGVMPVS